MSVDSQNLPIVPARMGRSLVIMALYAFFGATIGGFWFLVSGVTMSAFGGSASQEFTGQDVIAIVAMSPLVFIGATFVGLVPATATGLMLAIEFLLRGRVSWLATVLAPLVAVYLFDPELDGKFTQLSFYLGVAASLTIRLAFAPALNGAGLPRSPMHMRIIGGKGIVWRAVLALVSRGIASG